MLNFKIERHFLPIAVKYLLAHYGLGLLVGFTRSFLLTCFR